LSAVVGGLVIGGILAHRWSRPGSAPRLLAVALTCLAIGSMTVAVSAVPSGSVLVGLALLGFGGAIDASVIEASLQRIIPDRLRGRVLATRSVLTSLAVLAASTLAGWCSDHLGSVVLFGAIATGCALAAVVVGLRRRQSTHQHRVGTLYWTTRWVLRQLGFAYFRLHIDGLKHLPAHGPAILAGNHPSILDGILLLIVSPRPVRFLVAEEMFFHPYLHWLFQGMGCIPVYRTRTTNGDALRAAIDVLHRGDVIGIFPEGTTLDGGRLRILRRGVSLLALTTGAPVIPFGICGSRAAFPDGARAPRPTSISLALAPPVAYVRSAVHPVSPDLLRRVLEDLRWEILRAMRWAEAAHEEAARTEQGWRLQVALSALVILPLSGFLSLTANPSLDPVNRRGIS
jgi:1-acyl-sn-glycerol-3-phosphate acyltransferase